MFIGWTNLISLDITSFNTKYVIDMSHMFDSCNMIKSLDITHLDRNKVQNNSYMFN